MAARQIFLMKITDKKQDIKAVYKFCIVAICVLYALYLITVPILLTTSSNVQYMNTLIPQLVNFLGKVLEVCGIAVIYALCTYSIYKNGRGAYGRAYVICGASAFVKCLLAQTVYWLSSGGIPAINNGLIEELIWLVILPAALEVLQFTVFFLIVKRRIESFSASYEIASAGAKIKGVEYPVKDKLVFPFKSTFDTKNPLIYSSVIGGVVIGVSKLILTLLEEIDMAINGLAIKTAMDLLETLLRVFSNIACAGLAFAAMVFVIIKAFEIMANTKKHE